MCASVCSTQATCQIEEDSLEELTERIDALFAQSPAHILHHFVCDCATTEAQRHTLQEVLF